MPNVTRIIDQPLRATPPDEGDFLIHSTAAGSTQRVGYPQAAETLGIAFGAARVYTGQFEPTDSRAGDIWIPNDEFLLLRNRAGDGWLQVSFIPYDPGSGDPLITGDDDQLITGDDEPLVSV